MQREGKQKQKQINANKNGVKREKGTENERK